MKYSGNTQAPGGLFHDEEDCTGTIACSHNVACGFVRAGCNSHRAAGSGSRAQRCASGAGLRVDLRVPPLRRRPLRLDPRPLGASASRAPALGCAQVGASGRPLGVAGRTLAVIWKANDEAGLTPRFVILVRPAWAHSYGCKSRHKQVTASEAKRKCTGATECGEEAGGSPGPGDISLPR